MERNTNWRQGDLLSQAASESLGLADPEKNEKYAVIITHDCDLASDKETTVEVIVASLIEGGADAQFLHAKQPRRLHLVYDGNSTSSLTLELQHAKRKLIDRNDFLTTAEKNETFSISDQSKRTLRQWLAARYGRPAFPEEFENRLRKKEKKEDGKEGKRSVADAIAKALPTESTHIIGLFFDLGEKRWVEATENEPYELRIFVVYDAENGGPEARKAAEDGATDINSLFIRAYGSADQATEIALETCEAIGDTLFTLADLHRMDQWRLEYITIKDGDTFLAAGEMPG